MSIDQIQPWVPAHMSPSPAASSSSGEVETQTTVSLPSQWTPWLNLHDNIPRFIVDQAKIDRIKELHNRYISNITSSKLSMSEEKPPRKSLLKLLKSLTPEEWIVLSRSLDLFHVKKYFQAVPTDLEKRHSQLPALSRIVIDFHSRRPLSKEDLKDLPLQEKWHFFKHVCICCLDKNNIVHHSVLQKIAALEDRFWIPIPQKLLFFRNLNEYVPRIKHHLLPKAIHQIIASIPKTVTLYNDRKENINTEENSDIPSIWYRTPFNLTSSYSFSMVKMIESPKSPTDFTFLWIPVEKLSDEERWEILSHIFMYAPHIVPGHRLIDYFRNKTSSLDWTIGSSIQKIDGADEDESFGCIIDRNASRKIEELTTGLERASKNRGFSEVPMDIFGPGIHYVLSPDEFPNPTFAAIKNEVL